MSDNPRAEGLDEPIFRGDDVVLFTARLPVGLADALFHEAVVREATPSDVIAAALRTFLTDEKQR